MNRAEKRRAQRAGKSTDPLAVTWYSNSLWSPTGYGTQGAQAVPRMVGDGHFVAVASNYGLQATKTIYEGVPHYPMGVDVYSNDVIEPTFKEWSLLHPDLTPLVIALFDAWPLRGPAWDRMPVAIWTMVDHLPCPPRVLDFLRKRNVMPLAASRFAHQEITRAGVEAIYVPMAVDSNVYKPTATWTRDDGVELTGRQLMGFTDDDFVVSMVNANKSGGAMHRKAWAENLMAFSIFAEGKDDVRLYLHTERAGAYGGVDFGPLIASLEIPASKYRFVNQWAQHTGIPNEAMAALYTASDVFLAATLGEGFGLTVLEAGMCETPAIVSDFTCQPELVSDDSYLVGGQLWWDSAQAAWWQIPNVGEIVAALEAAYERGRVRSHAQRVNALAYDADTVFAEHWRPALARLADHSREVAPRKATGRPQGDGPLLTVYIPTYKRPDDLARLLDALTPQLTPDVEVIVADDDPDSTLASTMPPSVSYVRRESNIGGNENLQLGLEAGSGEWLWMIGDDDTVTPDAIATVLHYCEATAADRLILLSPFAPRGAAGMTGTPGQIEDAQPGLTIASTLITANVVRRSALDLETGRAHLDTMYGWAWAHAHIRSVHVVSEPCFIVGDEHAGEFVEASGRSMADVVKIWADLLTSGYGVPWTDGVASWNHVAVAKAAA